MSNPKKSALIPLFENGDQPPQEDFWQLIGRIFDGANADTAGNSFTGVFLGNTQGTYHTNQFGAVFPVQSGFVVGGMCVLRVLPDEPIRITGAEIVNEQSLDRLYAKNVTNWLRITVVRIDITPVTGVLVPVLNVEVLNAAEVKDPGKTETFIISDSLGGDIDLSSRNENGELQGGFVRVSVIFDRTTDAVYTLPALAGFAEGATLDLQVLIDAVGAALRLRSNADDSPLVNPGLPGITIQGGGDTGVWIISSSTEMKLKKNGSDWLLVRGNTAAQFEQSLIASRTLIGRLSANTGAREVLTIAQVMEAMAFDTAEAQPGQALIYDPEFEKFIPKELPESSGGTSSNDNLLALTYATELVWNMAGDTATPRLRARVTTNGAMRVSPDTFTNRPSGAFDFYLVITIGNNSDAVTLFPDTARTQWNTSDLLPTNLMAGTRVLLVGYYDGSAWSYTYSIGFALAGAAAPTGTATISGSLQVDDTAIFGHTFANTGGYTENGTVSFVRSYADLTAANADTNGTGGSEVLAPATTLAASTRTFVNTAALLNNYLKYWVRLRNNAGVQTLISSAASQIVAASTGVEMLASPAISAAVGNQSTGFTTMGVNLALNTSGAGSNLIALFVVSSKGGSLSDGTASSKGFNSATYNGIPLTLLERAHNSSGSKGRVSVFQLNQASFPADGTYSFDATSPEAATYAVVELVLLKNAAQATISKVAKASAGSSSTMTFPSLTSVAAGSLLATFLTGATGTGPGLFAPNSGQTEIVDTSTASADGTNLTRARMTKAVSSAGDYTESVTVAASSGGTAGITIAIAPA